MKPKSRAPEQNDLLRPRLTDMIDMRHELVRSGIDIHRSTLADWVGVALAKAIRHQSRRIEHVGLEAGNLSQWLHDGLVREGFTVSVMEARHVRAAFAAMRVKTDRHDARGIAQLVRLGWF
jgi:transposase